MNLKSEDVEKINKVLEYIASSTHTALDDTQSERCVSIPTKEYLRIKQIILNHSAAGKTGYGYLQRNGNTKEYLQIDFFGALYQRQKEEMDLQKLVDKERKINIRNAKWSFPLSIISIIIALATFLLAIFGVIKTTTICN